MKKNDKAPNQRVGRMEREVREIVASHLSRVKLQTPGLLTVSRVWVSGDLRLSRVMFTFLTVGDLSEEKGIRLVLEELEELRPELQELVGDGLRTRYTPKLEFVYDNGLEKGLKVQKLIEEVSQKKDTKS